jgi:hypothetical protein
MGIEEGRGFSGELCSVHVIERNDTAPRDAHG